MIEKGTPKFDDELVDHIVAEVERIRGAHPDAYGAFSFELRITSSKDTIEFLRGIPSGTPREEIQTLADVYAQRGRFSDDSDSPQAGFQEWVCLEIMPPDRE